MMKNQATRLDVLEAQKRQRDDLLAALIIVPAVIVLTAAVVVWTVAGWMA